MRSTHSFIEAMESRRLMSVAPMGSLVNAAPPQSIGMLLPAVQAAREAARTSSTPTVSEIVVTKSVDCSSPGLF